MSNWCFDMHEVPTVVAAVKPDDEGYFHFGDPPFPWELCAHFVRFHEISLTMTANGVC